MLLILVGNLFLVLEHLLQGNIDRLSLPVVECFISHYQLGAVAGVQGQVFLRESSERVV